MIKKKFDLIELRVDAISCNYNCDICYNGPLKEKILSADEIIQYSLKYVPFSNNISLLIHNEELAHPEIERLLEFMSIPPFIKRNLIPTNGWSLIHDKRYKTLENLARHGVKIFQFTVMGSSETHDQHAHRKGAFKDVLESAKKVKEEGFKIRWNYFLFANEVKGVPKTIEMMQEINESELVIQVPSYNGNAIKTDHLRPELDEILMLAKDFRKYFKHMLPTEKELTEQCLQNRESCIPSPDSRNDNLRLMAVRLKQNFDLYESLFPHRKIGNAKYLDAEEIIDIYLNKETTISRLWRHTSNRELVAYSNNSMKVYRPEDVRIKWFISFINSRYNNEDFLSFYR